MFKMVLTQSILTEKGANNALILFMVMYSDLSLEVMKSAVGTK